MVAKILLTTLILLLWQTPQGKPQPASAEATFNRAMELQQQNQWPEAAAAWRVFLQLEPQHAGAHANLGAVLAHLGQYEEAVKSYDNALRLNPQLTPVLFNLGVAHYRAGQYAKAVETLSRFLSTKPDAWQAQQLLGLALVELGRDEDAVPLLEAVLKANPQDVSLLFGLGLAYLRLNRPEVKTLIERLAADRVGAAVFILTQRTKLSGRFGLPTGQRSVGGSGKTFNRTAAPLFFAGRGLLAHGPQCGSRARV
jgi:tetratricopeptide (TPR) repeat protein